VVLSSWDFAAGVLVFRKGEGMLTLDEEPSDRGSEPYFHNDVENSEERPPKRQEPPQAVLTEEQVELKRLLRLMMAGHKPV
jgi:hypothetical protein